jgi:hypothetical protein
VEKEKQTFIDNNALIRTRLPNTSTIDICTNHGYLKGGKYEYSMPLPL